MKYLFLLATIISVIISATGLEETRNFTVNGTSNFCGKLQLVIEENSNRYLSLRRKMFEVQIKDQNKLINFMSNMTVNLETAKNRFSKIQKNALDVCINNSQAYKSHQNLSITANMNDNRNLQEHIDFLNKTIENSLNQTSSANKEISKIQTTITNNLKKLVNLLYDLEHLAHDKNKKWQDLVAEEDKKMKTSRVKIFGVPLWKDDFAMKRAEKEKYYWEQKVKTVDQFLNNTRMYIQWVQKVSNDLVEILVDQEFWYLEETLLNSRDVVADAAIKNKNMLEKKSEVLDWEENLLINQDVDQEEDPLNKNKASKFLFYDEVLMNDQAVISDNQKEDFSENEKNKVFKDIAKAMKEIYEDSCSLLERF